MIAGSSDGYIKLYDYRNNKTKRYLNITNFEITCMTTVNSSIIAVKY